jgi:NAD-dependent deacetylase
VYEIHGSFQTATCVYCHCQQDAKEYISSFIEKEAIPRCPHCNHILKPDAILLGEQLPVRLWRQVVNLAHTCDVMLVAGSSLEVLPVAALPMQALEWGADLIIVNQSSTYIDRKASVVLRGDVAEILPQITQAVIQNLGNPLPSQLNGT